VALNGNIDKGFKHELNQGRRTAMESISAACSMYTQRRQHLLGMAAPLTQDTERQRLCLPEGGWQKAKRVEPGAGVEAVVVPRSAAIQTVVTVIDTAQPV